MAVVTVRGIALAAVSLSIIGCQSDLTLPGKGPTEPPEQPLPSILSTVSGDGQEGVVGTQLPKPLRVRVTDAAVNPMQDVSVGFTSEVPGAEVSPSVTTTNAGGYADVRIQLGSVEGTQTVEAYLVDDTGLRTTFSLTAMPEKQHDNPGGGGGDGGGNDGDGGDGHHDGHDHDGGHEHDGGHGHHGGHDDD